MFVQRTVVLTALKSVAGSTGLGDVLRRGMARTTRGRRHNNNNNNNRPKPAAATSSSEPVLAVEDTDVVSPPADDPDADFIVSELSKLKGMSPEDARKYLADVEAAAMAQLAELEDDDGTDADGGVDASDYAKDAIVDIPPPRPSPQSFEVLSSHMQRKNKGEGDGFGFSSDEEARGDDDGGMSSDSDGEEGFLGLNDQEISIAGDDDEIPAGYPAQWPPPRPDPGYGRFVPPADIEAARQARLEKQRREQAAVLNARLTPPKPRERQDSVRQQRVAANLQRAAAAVLAEHSIRDPRLYPAGLPIEFTENVKVSKCLRYATLCWSLPLPYDGPAVAPPEPPSVWRPHVSRRPLSNAVRRERRQATDGYRPAVARILNGVSAALTEHSKTLRRQIGRRVRMKYVPEIQFMRDVEAEDEDDLYAELDRLRAEMKGRSL